MSLRLLAGLVVSCLICSCTSRQPIFHETPQLKWTKREVAGLTIELIDAVAAESLAFTRDGTVMATLGLKSAPPTAPLLEWEIVSGHLRVTGYDELTLLSRDSNTVTVRRSNGKVVKYKIIRHERTV